MKRWKKPQVGKQENGLNILNQEPEDRNKDKHLKVESMNHFGEEAKFSKEL